MARFTFFCPAGALNAARAKAQELGDGPGTFSVPLSTQPGITDPAQATWYAMSGEELRAGYADEMDVQLDPMVKVLPLEDGQTFDDHLALVNPRLYRIIESL
jgi:hypothetical protein